ncbi:exodeoxyribonuclease VII large subunit [Vulcanococcus limneticus]|uniref:exodeoxyribonuclease VII large subunit n=1 Tax=Vulcanococcus limneticus TaxID=2170428 RepID=UPI00398BFA84
MSAESGLPRYGVAELNQAIGTLLERGFAPRFLLDATVSRPQLKKGHLWLTLVDDQASISAVVWASQLAKLSHRPAEGDGVVVVGRLNFWAARANLCVQVLDLRPSLSAVLRRFEQVRQALEPEGLFAPERKQPLPQMPAAIALLTSVPSSALADMLRTAAERWPSTRIHVVPIPVQGAVEAQICQALTSVILQAEGLSLEAVVLARGGGSREDLAVFDGEELARLIAACPLPVVTGLGHEDDTTIADLVADYRAATPTAAIVALLPERSSIGLALGQIRAHLGQLVALRLQAERQRQRGRLEQLDRCHPSRLLQERRRELGHRLELLGALSPQRLLERGFALVRGESGQLVRSVGQLHAGDSLQVELADGSIGAQVTAVRPSPPGS